MICFDHVSKRFGAAAVLRDLSFRVEQGETFVVIGASGAGKSVTLKHMVGLLAPDEGGVTVEGQDVGALRGRALAAFRRRFGYLFQSGALLAWLSVAENVALPLRERRVMSAAAIRDRVAQVLGLVGLEADGDKMPAEISGGMRKRAGLARAIVEEPRIMLYDEPTSGLDPVTSRTIDALIGRMQRELRVTSVVVTHDLHSALAIGSRIAMLHEGRFIEAAAPAAFIRSPHEPVQRFLQSQYITQKAPWDRRTT